MPSKTTDEGLKRVIGVPALAAAVVNISIGSGIYVLPAVICIQLGAAGVIGYLLCALMFASIILCYVEIGSRVKTTGGSYAYVEAAFGPLAGYIINWLFFFGWGILADAAVMNLVADSLSVAFPLLSHPVMRGMLFFILLGLMVLVNICGADKSVRFVTAFTVIKLLPLFAIIIFGFSHVQLSNIKIEHLPSVKTFGDTALFLFFVFAGFETSLNASGEIKDPRRTVPRGILLGGIIVLVILLLIQTVVQGVLGSNITEFKNAPLAAVAQRIAGSTGIIILLFAAALSGLVTVNGDVLASSRLLFAGANDRLFPKFLGKAHPRFNTPYWAVISFAAMIFVFSVSGGFKQLAVLASGALLIIYLGVVLAVIKFRFKKDNTAEKYFKVPGGLIIPGIAIAAIMYVLSNLSRQETVSIIIFIAVLCIIYFVMRKWQKRAVSKTVRVEEQEQASLITTVT
jgi:APA family basic amino acid/polyamine antiporter